MTPPDLSTASTALGRWLAALHALGDPAVTDAAVTPDARVERFGWDASRGTLVETLVGTEEVAGWCARTPSTVRFSVAAAQPDPDGFRARYTVTVGDYVNHGDWRFALAPDGRITWLEHRPDDLPDDWREGVPEGKSLGPPAHGAPDHDHDHDHDHG